MLEDNQISILKYEKLKFRNKILKEKEQGKQKLHKGNQNKYLINSNEYISAKDKGNPRVYKSYLLKNEDPIENNKKEYYSYVEELYIEAVGRGSIEALYNNTYEIKEYYKFNKIIGRSNIKNITSLKRPAPPEKSNYKTTHKIKIIYGSNGKQYHIVSIDEKEE